MAYLKEQVLINMINDNELLRVESILKENKRIKGDIPIWFISGFVLGGLIVSIIHWFA